MSGEVRERMKETVSKTCERQDQTRKKETTKKKEESGDSEQLNPKQRFKWCSFFSPGGF